MFRLRRRKAPEGTSERGAELSSAPSYRRDDEAVEYRTEEHNPRRESREGDIGDPADKTARGGFQPLPRCPSCRTAIGFEQSECHSCGRGLKKV